ncbi:MAG TPA: LacI family DNA-binding transcriptional regulator [Bacteroidales bacterium]|nr:LacI family DNA-binding transcriptional regulator [Bacteroidales bacterium]
MKSSKEVTIYDVARVLNISPSTVSRGLKGHPHIRKETISRIKAVATEMGYRHNKFASNLRLKKTNTLGLVVPKLNSYFMATVIAGIEKITNENGYGLIISTSQETESLEISSVHTLFNSRVDGMMVSLAYDTKDPLHFNILFEKKIPLVFFDRIMDCPGCISVVIDNYRAGYEVTSHLLQQGCSRIVHVGGNIKRNVYADRLNGYKKALSDAGITPDKEYLMIGDLSENTGVEAARKILKMKQMPDGVFAANDTTAVSMIMELLEKGVRIPEDICVAGFNNEPISRIIQPNLTTVNYPAMKIGEITASALIGILNNVHPEKNKIIVDHKLIIRQSSLRNK